MMENCKIKVSELTLPLKEYVVVDEGATVADALKTLKQKNDENKGKYPHRAILVQDGKKRIIGKLDHFCILRGVLENPVKQFEKHAQNIMGSHQDMVLRASQNLNLLDENMEVLIERAKSISVNKLMQPILCKIDENASLVDAIRLFDQYQTLSMLVTRRNEIVGILRLVDLFDEIAENIRES